MSGFLDLCGTLRISNGIALTESVTPKVPRLCSLCLFTFGRGLLLHLNISEMMQSWLKFRYSKSPVHDIYKHGEQSLGTFGVTDSANVTARTGTVKMYQHPFVFVFDGLSPSRGQHIFPTPLYDLKQLFWIIMTDHFSFFSFWNETKQM